MKLLHLFVGVGLYLTGFCLADYSDYQKEQFRKITQFCQKKLSIPDELNILERTMYNRDYNYGDIEKQYLICGQKQLGWLGEDEKFNTKEIEDFFAENYDAEKVKQFVSICANDDIESLEEKAANFHSCFFEKKTFAL